MDTALKRPTPCFEALYAEGGPPAIPPSKLLRALMLQCLYSVRKERLLMEQLDYNLLFRWLVGLNMDDWFRDFTVFSKNRARLLEADVAPNTGRPGGSAVDERTTSHAGYMVSQTKRKRVEEIFGCFKTVALMRRTRFRGLERVGWMFTWAAAPYNLLHLGNLVGPTP